MNGEFDTPIDPRFPAFVATNLSEALAGPFSPSSASVSVLGTRASGMVISERLRPGGAVQREMSRRTTGVFGHRLYAGITSGHFMAQTVPLVDPDMIIKGFFGRTVEGLSIHGPQPPPLEHRGLAGHIRGVATFANNLVGLSAGSRGDTRAFVADVTRFEELAANPGDLDDQRLLALILLGRDHVVHGWVLSSASILLCTAYGMILRILCGRDVMPNAGIDVASAQSLGAVHRLAAQARRDPVVAGLLTGPDVDLDTLTERSPSFAAALTRELALIGHRGPGEVEMRCATYGDDPRAAAADGGQGDGGGAARSTEFAGHPALGRAGRGTGHRTAARARGAARPHGARDLGTAAACFASRAAASPTPVSSASPTTCST